VVILWSKDRVLGGLVVGSRAPREFSPADINLLIAVGSQISNAIDRSVLYEETRQAYENCAARRNSFSTAKRWLPSANSSPVWRTSSTIH